MFVRWPLPFLQRFAAVILRIREPKTTALIFASGKMVVTGAKTEDACRQAARKHARIVQKVGFEIKFVDFKIQNMVGSCDVKFPIRLEGLAVAHGQFSSVRRPRGAGAGRTHPSHERPSHKRPNLPGYRRLRTFASTNRSFSPASCTACSYPRSSCSSLCLARSS